MQISASILDAEHLSAWPKRCRSLISKSAKSALVKGDKRSGLCTDLKMCPPCSEQWLTAFRPPCSARPWWRGCASCWPDRGLLTLGTARAQTFRRYGVVRQRAHSIADGYTESIQQLVAFLSTHFR